MSVMKVESTEIFYLNIPETRVVDIDEVLFKYIVRLEQAGQLKYV